MMSDGWYALQATGTAILGAAMLVRPGFWVAAVSKRLDRRLAGRLGRGSKAHLEELHALQTYNLNFRTGFVRVAGALLVLVSIAMFALIFF
ncbi:hypothetical protein U1769_14965 [Sphingomonas sp. ZT3P38]|uniref:hypothetical protein n=1 Tax=Parasphingomonas zepuensis TaxID=3096161 RepID=UPI002FC8DEE5